MTATVVTTSAALSKKKNGWATVPRRERAATCPYKKTSHANGDGSFCLGHMMREHAAYH